MAHAPRDRFGLTWHPLLAGRILAHADRLDIVEVIPEGRFLETRRSRRALRTLSRDIPVAIHGVSLGLSSAEGVDPRRLDAFARLMDDVRPEHWSEHLAFVRAGGIELGHLAAPSRTALTLEATAENVHRACRHVGSHPMVENVATLIDPPASDRSEREWLLGLLDACPADLLLDLHNVVTNGRNLGYDPEAFVAALPAHRIRAVHLTGGADVEASSGERRILDDHRHAVPESVYRLLQQVGERVPHPVDVILERDDSFPPFEQLLDELDRARAALAAGRARRSAIEQALRALNELPASTGHGAHPRMGRAPEGRTPVPVEPGTARGDAGRLVGRRQWRPQRERRLPLRETAAAADRLADPLPAETHRRHRDLQRRRRQRTRRQHRRHR